jgi:hypothetical protein
MRRARRIAPVIGALVLVPALFVGACSSDKGSSSDRTTTTKASTTTTASSTTTPTLPFPEAIAAVQSQLDAAKGDQCTLAKFLVTRGAVPPPATTEEGKQVVTYLADTLNAVADTTPPTEAQAKADLQQAAKDLQAEGAQAGYTKEWLAGDSTPKALSDPKVTAALRAFQTRTTKECGGVGSTTVPTPTTAR